MDRHAIEVVHVGSAARDLASDDARGWRLGGGVTYAALTTARLGLRTAALIGVDAAAAAATELTWLRDAGVEIRLVHLGECPVFENRETASGRVQSALAAGRPIARPEALPTAWHAAAAWSLVPVAGELDDRWAGVPGREALVAVGWQGLLRRLVAGAVVERIAPARNAVLARADLVGVSENDLAPGTEFLDLAGLLRPGARLVVTDGARGGAILTNGLDGAVSRDAFPAVTGGPEIDPTGAGDTFLASYLAATIRPGVLDRTGGSVTPTRFAAAAASRTVEGIGLGGVPDLAAVDARLAGMS